MSLADQEKADRVASQAADWYARLANEDASEAAWDRYWKWRDADRDHAAAFDRISDHWRMLGRLADKPEIVELRMAALAQPPVRHRNWRPLVAAVSAAVFITSGIFMLQRGTLDALDEGPAIATAPTDAGQRPGSDKTPEPRLADAKERTTPVQMAGSLPAFSSQYQTHTGERSKFRLPDGSVIELNTNSLVDVSFSGGVRNLKLLRGEALFRVAHNKAHPFVVDVAQNRVTALGTVFSVRHDAERAIVTLIEGKVRVDLLSGGRSTQTAQLSPGEQLATAASAPFRISKADLTGATSWSQGRLVFRNKSLDEVVREINRYSDRKIVIGDDRLASVRVSGTFRIQSANRFADTLASSFGFVVSSQSPADELIILPKARPQKPEPANPPVENMSEEKN